jgi:CelD/BcsL family acetyltransferase involved in cellulose biosynthesis
MVTTIRTFTRDRDAGNSYKLSYNPSRARVALSAEGPMALGFSELLAVRAAANVEEARAAWRELESLVLARGYVAAKTYTV